LGANALAVRLQPTRVEVRAGRIIELLNDIASIFVANGKKFFYRWGECINQAWGAEAGAKTTGLPTLSRKVRRNGSAFSILRKTRPFSARRAAPCQALAAMPP
jgi:hypothetical protein